MKTKAPSRTAPAEKIALTDKFAFTVAEAVELSNVCRSNIFTAIASGKLLARKRGRSTLIRQEDLRDWINSLPAYTPSAPRGIALQQVERRRALAAAAAE